MQSSCDLLILTAKFGTGHVSVSNALREHIHTVDSQIKIEVADMHEIMHPSGYKSIYKSYEIMVKHLPIFYNQYYYGKEKFPRLQKMDTASHTNLKKLALYLEGKKPKVVISTFPLCTGYMSKYKETYNSTIPLITCITDVVDNNEWLYPQNNLYFVADDCIRESLLKKGLSEETVYTTGIPIREKFLIAQDSESLKNKLGFNKRDKIVLMMGGGLGLFPKDEPFYTWLSTLEDVKVVVLTGKNKHLFNKLNKLEAPNLHIFKHTDHVSEFMKSADVLIGKSGGITLYEAISTVLPMIIYKPLLGQEVKNCQFIKEKEIGIVVDGIEPLKEVLLTMLAQSETRNHLIGQLQILQKKIDMTLLGQKIVEVYHKAEASNR